MNRHAGAVGSVIDRVEHAAAAATAMALRRTTRSRGRRPSWLRAATEVALVGVDRDGDDTAVVEVQSARLGEAAKPLFDEQWLFDDDRPDEDATGFDLLGKTINDIQSGQAENEDFDSGLLKRLIAFSKPLDRDVEAIEFQISGTPTVDQRLVGLSRALNEQTPSNRRVRVMGRLDLLSNSDSLFRILLPGDQKVRGTWKMDDIAKLRSMLNEDVVINGTAVFRPSGKLLRVDAETMHVAEAGDHLFEKLPQPLPIGLPVKSYLQKQSSSRSMQSVMGQWPGDESDEQILEALEEMS